MAIRHFSKNNLIFKLYGSIFSLDESYTIVEPKIAKSGNWEVWDLEAEGTTSTKTIEEVEFLPGNIVLEIETGSDLNVEAVHDIIASFLIGIDYGEQDMRERYRKMTKFAFASLTGEISDGTLEEAADEYFHRND